MFKKEIINNKQIIQNWSKQTTRKVVVSDTEKFEITKKNGKLLITSINKKMVMNPKTDFVQARIDLEINDSELVVEIRPFISKIFTVISVGVFFFSLLMLNKSIFHTLGILLVFGSIFYSNFSKLNKAVLAFKTRLEKIDYSKIN